MRHLEFAGVSFAYGAEPVGLADSIVPHIPNVEHRRDVDAGSGRGSRHRSDTRDPSPPAADTRPHRIKQLGVFIGILTVDQLRLNTEVLGDDFRRSAIGLRGEELDDGGFADNGHGLGFDFQRDNGHSGTFRTCCLLMLVLPLTSPIRNQFF